VPDGFAVPAGKTPQLEQLRAELGGGQFAPSAVSFFDDDANNITRAVAAGYTHSFLVPRGPAGGFTSAFVAGLANELDERERSVLLGL
jgi:hypothetical protein